MNMMNNKYEISHLPVHIEHPSKYATYIYI